ncbi:MAG: Fe-S-cluster redox protein [Candidatus Woesebacteria bacterium GW2011_GWB1_39_12]|uniref:Fe-S-cluster redox protein n=1 Tax=Candidatus Woesebacteria bacterium GW2011_GWB1_39_12 TaxID=1618574 RepID=A0A0G0QDV5_9BACT|nr:MAG: Fe-S-cluster redox protein [Candidatus Woesebacteria bacterium GW2011_GWB1_39_12]
MKISSIHREKFEGKVYNFTSLPDHNYFCSEALLHNCDVPMVGSGKNATKNDLLNQVAIAMTLHPEISFSNRLNIHYARMGEPSLNYRNVLESAEILQNLRSNFKVHPVVSTMMPRHNKYLSGFLLQWAQRIKNDVYDGNAGLQLSINSTSDAERDEMFSGNASSLEEIGAIVSNLPKPKGRKYTLNFAISGYEIDPHKLLRYFDPDDWLCKLTPMHKTGTALSNDISTIGDYTTLAPYTGYEDALKAAGYDVIVFVASKEEDLGRITCGNAILSGSLPQVEYMELNVEGESE